MSIFNINNLEKFAVWDCKSAKTKKNDKFGLILVLHAAVLHFKSMNSHLLCIDSSTTHYSVLGEVEFH